MALKKRKTVTTETETYHVCDFCNQEIDDGEHVPVATNVRLEYESHRQTRVGRVDIDRGKHAFEGAVFSVGYDEKIDLCPFCYNNLFQSGDDS